MSHLPCGPVALLAHKLVELQHSQLKLAVGNYSVESTLPRELQEEVSNYVPNQVLGSCIIAELGVWSVLTCLGL